MEEQNGIAIREAALELARSQGLLSEKYSDNSVRLQEICDIQNRVTGNLAGYDCPDCLNRGYSYYVSDGEVITRKCACLKPRRSIQALKESGLEDVSSQYTLENYKAASPWQKSILDKAKQYISDNSTPARWFYIGGQVGSGKSHICTAVTIEKMKQGRNFKYMLWRDDMQRLKSNVTEGIYADLMQKYKRPDILYIDDLFKTERGKNVTTSDITTTFEIINYRYMSNGAITIISSETPLNRIIEEIDEGIGSRIAQRAKPYILSIAPDMNKNYRLYGGGSA